MSEKVVITVEERTLLGKKVRQLRRQGMVPAVVYGGGKPGMPVVAPVGLMEKTLHDAGKHHPVQLTVGGKDYLAMIKQIERDPVKRRLRHISFQTVKRGEKVQASIPLRIEGEGETPAEKAGLVVLKALETVDVEAQPLHLPDALTVLGDKLAEVGDQVTVADIAPVAHVAVLADPTQLVASVYEPAALAAQNEAAGGAADEANEVDDDQTVAPEESGTADS